MNDQMKQIINDIVNEVAESNDEKHELYERYYNSLEQLYAALIDQGYAQEEAETKAIELFKQDVYDEEMMVRPHEPIQTQILLTLAFASILYSFSVYLVQLFLEGDAYIWWLVLSVSINGLLLFSVYRKVNLKHQWLFNSLLIIHILIYFNGLGLALSIDHFITGMFTVYDILLMLLAIILIYIHVIFNNKMTRLKKGFHLYNITTGLVIIGLNLFVFVLVALFSGITSRNFLVIIPTLAWAVLYILQIKLLDRKWIKLAFIIAIIPLLVVSGFIVFNLFI